MNRAVLWVSLFFCALLQAVLPAWQAVGQAKPPLLLAAVLYYALSRDHHQVLESALLAGILQDGLGPIPMGVSATAFVTIGLLVNHYRERLFGDFWFTHILLGVGSSVMLSFIHYFFLVGLGLRTGIPFPFVLNKALGMSLLGIVIFPLVYRLIHHLDLALGNLTEEIR